MTSSLRSVSLDDKYKLDQTKAYLAGIEALVRLPILQHQRDQERGLNTAGFVSGYRGSPLGGVDHAMWHAEEHLTKHNIHFVPGVNEELAATAVRGAAINSQSIPHLYALIVVGAANNQLADVTHADMLSKRGILYAPDFVVNGGGIIETHHQNSGSMEQSREHIARASETVTRIFELSEEQQILTVAVAEKMAEEKFMAKSAISNAA